jgi:hypothetical protein
MKKITSSRNELLKDKVLALFREVNLISLTICKRQTEVKVLAPLSLKINVPQE